MRRRDIQADIFALISDGKVWSMRVIAERVEVSYKTVYRHIHDLSYLFNIRIFCGGIQKGGVQLIGERKISIEGLTSEDIELIITTLSKLDQKNDRIEHFISQLLKVIATKE